MIKVFFVKKILSTFSSGPIFFENLLLSVMPKLADLDPCLRDSVPAEHLNIGYWKGLPPAQRLILLTFSSTICSHSFPIITLKALLSPLSGCWFICQSILPNCFSPALNELFCSKSPLNLFCWSKPRFSNNWTVEWFNEFPFSRW